MRHKRATDYGGRTPRGFWIESAFIALIALAFIAALLAMVAYAHAQPVSSTDIRVIDGPRLAREMESQNIGNRNAQYREPLPMRAVPASDR